MKLRHISFVDNYQVREIHKSGMVGGTLFVKGPSGPPIESKNSAITLSRVNFFGYVGHASII